MNRNEGKRELFWEIMFSGADLGMILFVGALMGLWLFSDRQGLEIVMDRLGLFFVIYFVPVTNFSGRRTLILSQLY